jgi:hypothetical protein
MAGTPGEGQLWSGQTNQPIQIQFLASASFHLEKIPKTLIVLQTVIMWLIILIF